MGSGSAKRARQHVFQNQGSIEDLSPQQQKYIRKEIDRMHREITGTGFRGAEMREFPCQMLSGKTALIPVYAEPVYNEEDGKYYLDDELIVSNAYKRKVRRDKQASQPKVDKGAQEKSIVNLEPEVLGDETQ